jgi:hypothetical protein
MAPFGPEERKNATYTLSATPPQQCTKDARAKTISTWSTPMIIGLNRWIATKIAASQEVSDPFDY